MENRAGTTFRRDKGFTLIEVIVSLVIIAILAVVASMGITKATQGYIFAQKSVETAQNGQMALTRLGKEFMVISDISASSATSLNYSSYKQGVKGNHTVSLSGANLLLDGDILTGRVGGFSLAWYESVSDTTPQSNWDSNQKIVAMTLTLQGPDDLPVTFSKRVSPRNMGE